MNRGLQPPPREELYHEILPSGEVGCEARWGFQPPEPRSIGAKREELYHEILPSGEVVLVLRPAVVRGSWGLLGVVRTIFLVFLHYILYLQKLIPNYLIPVHQYKSTLLIIDSVKKFFFLNHSLI